MRARSLLAQRTSDSGGSDGWRPPMARQKKPMLRRRAGPLCADGHATVAVPATTQAGQPEPATSSGDTTAIASQNSFVTAATF
eukprot:11215980-Lingulodinium_polyedra.AAC.1